MYIRLTRGRFEPAKYDEVMGVLRDVTSIVRGLPGFQGTQGGADRATGRFIGVSTWDSAEHADFPRTAVGDLVPRMQALGVQMEPPEIYESVL